MIGDEVMAFFIPAFRDDLQHAAMQAATDILRGVGYGPDKEPWLPVGIGVNFGEAYVGKVGTGEVSDFTAPGDTVNTAARLQGHKRAGVIAVSESVYSHIATQYPDVPRQDIELKGKSEPFGAHIISIGWDTGCPTVRVSANAGALPGAGASSASG